jgi:hypothetical protein
LLDHESVGDDFDSALMPESETDGEGIDDVPLFVDETEVEDFLDDVPLLAAEADDADFDDGPLPSVETDDADFGDSPLSADETDDADFDDSPLPADETDDADFDDGPLSADETDDADFDDGPLSAEETEDADFDDGPLSADETDGPDSSESVNEGNAEKPDELDFDFQLDSLDCELGEMAPEIHLSDEDELADEHWTDTDDPPPDIVKTSLTAGAMTSSHVDSGSPVSRWSTLQKEWDIAFSDDPNVDNSGTVYFISIDNTEGLEDRFGAVGTEDLIMEVQSVLYLEVSAAKESLHRVKDSTFLFMSNETGADAMQKRGEKLAWLIRTSSFDVSRDPVHITVSVAAIPFTSLFTSLDSYLNAGKMAVAGLRESSPEQIGDGAVVHSPGLSEVSGMMRTYSWPGLRSCWSMINSRCNTSP